MTHRKLASLLQCKEGELRIALQELSHRLSGSGVTLIEAQTGVSLAVSREATPMLQEALKRDLERDMGDAGLEVLAITLYCGPSTRARIDYIRGVNSSSTLRNLLARGLVERSENPEDAREYLYRPTVELLAHLGITHTRELPDHEVILAELKTFEKENKENEEKAQEGTSAV